MIGVQFFRHLFSSFGLTAMGFWMYHLVAGEALYFEPEDSAIPIAASICAVYAMVRTLLHYVLHEPSAAQSATDAARSTSED